MPMNMPLPTKAKMTALVCSGRNRPKVVYWRLRFRSGQNSWQAMSRPAANPTSPQITVAMAKARTIRLSYLKVSTFMVEGCIGGPPGAAARVSAVCLEMENEVHGETVVEQALGFGQAFLIGESEV